MAQLLFDRDSTNTHLNITKRHTRLCRQVPGAEDLITAIQPPYDALIEKQKATNQAKENREMAYDDVMFNDTILDDRVRSAFERCKQYDRDNPGRPLLLLVFPDGKYSGIVKTAFTKEPDVVANLVARIKSLGDDHELNDLVAYLEEGITQCRDALNAYHDSIKKQKEAEALEDIAKSNLNRQYEFNYLDAVKKFGKSFANRLFPVIHSSSRNRVDETNDESNQTDE
jgi:hypothetical protein